MPIPYLGSKMPIPYLGSKRKSAGKIYQTINKGLDEAKCLEFVSREEFFDIVNNPDKYEDWYVGYVQCIWSFGNNQKGYLFGKDIETYKKAGHELAINTNPELILKLIPTIPKKYIDGILRQKDWHLRRIALDKVSKALKTRILELQQLERLEQATFQSRDYRDVTIPDGAVIYCDPPYRGTAEYAEGGFSHEEFWDWCRNKSKNHKVYISEYAAPYDFESILEFSQRSTLQGGHQAHLNQPKEKLFVLKK